MDMSKIMNALTGTFLPVSILILVKFFLSFVAFFGTSIWLLVALSLSISLLDGKLTNNKALLPIKLLGCVVTLGVIIVLEIYFEGRMIIPLLGAASALIFGSNGIRKEWWFLTVIFFFISLMLVSATIFVLSLEPSSPVFLFGLLSASAFSFLAEYFQCRRTTRDPVFH